MRRLILTLWLIVPLLGGVGWADALCVEGACCEPEVAAGPSPVDHCAAMAAAAASQQPVPVRGDLGGSCDCSLTADTGPSAPYVAAPASAPSTPPDATAAALGMSAAAPLAPVVVSRVPVRDRAPPGHGPPLYLAHASFLN